MHLLSSYKTLLYRILWTSANQLGQLIIFICYSYLIILVDNLPKKYFAFLKTLDNTQISRAHCFWELAIDMVSRDPKSGSKFKFTGRHFWFLLWFWCNRLYQLCYHKRDIKIFKLFLFEIFSLISSFSSTLKNVRYLTFCKVFLELY